MRRGTASFPRKMARTCSCISAPSRLRASRAWRRGTGSSSRSPRGPRGSRPPTSARRRQPTYQGRVPVSPGPGSTPVRVLAGTAPREHPSSPVRFILPTPRDIPGHHGPARRGGGAARSEDGGRGVSCLFIPPAGQKNSPDGACGSFCRAAPLVRRAGPSGPVVPGPSRATYDCVCLGLGGDHLTAHRRGTHRLDHLPFSARPKEGPRNPQPWIGRRLPTRGSVTLSPAELPERTPREPVCALTDLRSCYYRDPAEQSKMILTSR